LRREELQESSGPPLERVPSGTCAQKVVTSAGGGQRTISFGIVQSSNFVLARASFLYQIKIYSSVRKSPNGSTISRSGAEITCRLTKPVRAD